MKFSIVVPLYNKEDYVEASLRSALNQNFTDYEMIVVDDGSQDRSLPVVEKLLASDPHYPEKVKVIHQENQGTSAARNTGIDLAQGDYVCFLDADDRWYPDYLSTVSELIDLYPEAGMFVTAYRILLPHGRIVYSTRLTPEKGCLDSFWKTLAMGRYDLVWTSVTTIRRRDLKLIGGFKVGEKLGQDLDLWARMARINPLVAYSSKVCADYQRDTRENARTRVKVAYAKAFMKDLKDEMKKEHTPAEQKAIQWKYDRKMLVYLFTSILNGERKQVREEIQRWKAGCLKMKLAEGILWVMSFSPLCFCQWIYDWRLRLY